MYSNKLYTPLRYPGGKARFAPFIADRMRANDLAGGHYLEPYAGGAGVALELLFDEVVTDVHINDLDPAVFAFWHAAKHHGDTLVDMVQNEPINMDAWRHWRSVLRGEVDAEPVARGFATLFINRTNHSGILKGGVIGGLQQTGVYKLDARFKRDALVTRLKRITARSDNIHVYCEDALALLRRSTSLLPRKSLIYLDPPYYVKGSGLYRNFYQHEDHQAIASLLQKRAFSRRWIVSYDNAEEIRAMYAKVRSVSYGLKYTANRRYTGDEVMFFDSRLKLDEISYEHGDSSAD